MKELVQGDERDDDQFVLDTFSVGNKRKLTNGMLSLDAMRHV